MHLHAAARRGDLADVRWCLSRGTPVDARDAAGDTPLLAALGSLRAFDRRPGPRATVGTVELLLEAGADPGATGAYGHTPLALAVQAGEASLQLTRRLEAAGVDLRWVGHAGYTALIHACYQPPGEGKYAVLRHLVAGGADLDATSNHGESPLSVCLYFGDFDGLRWLADAGADVATLGWDAAFGRFALAAEDDPAAWEGVRGRLEDSERRWRLTPLLLAAKAGSVRKLDWLLQQGADVKARGHCDQTALHLAASHGHVAVVRRLLETGLPVDVRNEFGQTPLMTACEWGHAEVVATLLEAGAAVDLEDHLQSRPVHHASSQAVWRLLVDRCGADLNVVSGDGRWPLLAAAERNDVEAIRWLLKAGARIDLTSTGATALHAAVGADAREAAAFLLEAGADPNAPDVDGCTPLFFARSRQVIGMLLEAGANRAWSDQAGSRAGEWYRDPLLREALDGKMA